MKRSGLSMTRYLSLLARMPTMGAWAEHGFTFFALGVLSLCLLAAFAGELAGAEQMQFRGALLSPVLRCSVLAFLSLYAAMHVSRERQTRQDETWLCQPAPRPLYGLGVWLGQVLLSLWSVAVVFCFLSFLFPFSAAWTWSCSLYLEAVIVVSCSLFFSMACRNVAAVFFLTSACWLLARFAGTLSQISQGALLADSWGGHAWVQALWIGWTWLLPDLELFTRTEWLVWQKGLGAPALWPVCKETLCALLWFAAIGGMLTVRRRRMGDVRRWIWQAPSAALALMALVLQISMEPSNGRESPSDEGKSAAGLAGLGVPHTYAVRLRQWTEPLTAARLVSLSLLSLDSDQGNATALRDLDMRNVMAWLSLASDLDADSEYPLRLAGLFYSQTPDPRQRRVSIEFLRRAYLDAPHAREHWMWLAVWQARYRLRDPAYADRLRETLRRARHDAAAFSSIHAR